MGEAKDTYNNQRFADSTCVQRWVDERWQGGVSAFSRGWNRIPPTRRGVLGRRVQVSPGVVPPDGSMVIRKGKTPRSHQIDGEKKAWRWNDNGTTRVNGLFPYSVWHGTLQRQRLEHLFEYFLLHKYESNVYILYQNDKLHSHYKCLDSQYISIYCSSPSYV